MQQSGQLQDDFEDQFADLAKKIVHMHEASKAPRDKDWIRKRRGLITKLHSMWKQQNDAMDMLKEGLAIAVRDLLRVGSAGASEAVVLADFTNEALERLRAKEEDEALSAVGSAEVGAMPSGEEASTFSARQKYLTYFLEGTGRSPSEGALGMWSPEPPVTPEQLSWTDFEWAKFWSHLGGFEVSWEGANTCDVNGWLPLHYAMQATVYWSQAHKVVRGLVPMMYTKRLQAKTTGGRPKGWTALHMGANGSDRETVRSQLCELLLEYGVDVDVPDDLGRTPLHLAAGTGVVDAAKVLVAAGADVYHLDLKGRNCLDKCEKSSGTMKECPAVPRRCLGLGACLQHWHCVIDEACAAALILFPLLHWLQFIRNA